MSNTVKYYDFNREIRIGRNVIELSRNMGAVSPEFSRGFNTAVERALEIFIKLEEESNEE